MRKLLASFIGCLRPEKRRLQLGSIQSDEVHQVAVRALEAFHRLEVSHSFTPSEHVFLNYLSEIIEEYEKKRYPVSPRAA